MSGFISSLLNIFFSYGVRQRFVSKIDVIRSIWLKSQFKKFGRHSRIGKIGRLRGLKYIEIGEKTVLQEFIFLTAWETEDGVLNGNCPDLRIGDSCNFGAFGHITCSNRILIGNNCLVGKFVTITDNSHGNTEDLSLNVPPCDRPIYSKGSVVIEDNVWIGDKSTILPNVHIGKNAVIGANSVVTKDVPANAVVAGNPAKVLRVIS